MIHGFKSRSIPAILHCSYLHSAHHLLVADGGHEGTDRCLVVQGEAVDDFEWVAGVVGEVLGHIHAGEGLHYTGSDVDAVKRNSGTSVADEQTCQRRIRGSA